jgi:hypothetical protein
LRQELKLFDIKKTVLEKKSRPLSFQKSVVVYIFLEII